MDTLNKYIKKIYQFLKTHKKKWLTLIVFSVVFFLILFPYEEAVSYLTNQLNKRTKSAVQLQYDSFFIHPLGPALVFNNPKIFFAGKQNVLTARKLSLQPSYKSLLQLKPGGFITIRWKEGASLHLTVQKTQLKNENKAGWLFQLKTRNFNPSFLSAFAPILSKVRGKLNITMEALLDPLFSVQPTVSWNISGHGIHSRILSYSSPIGVFTFPYFKWNQFNSVGFMKKGEVTISEFSLGTQKDSSQINSRAVVSFELKKHALSKRIKPRFKSYNIGLDMTISEDLIKQFDPPLHTFLSQISSKTPRGWRYLGLISGAGFSLPTPSPVSRLPTLQEIQNPKEQNIENF